MANKRMFTMKIVDSDAFLDMPLSTQCLYFHLNMRADDDGFIGNPKKILRIVGASEDDLKLLIAKKFLLAFENGVIVIKHWRMHNTLSSSRYNETSYIEEKKTLYLKENNSYSFDNGNKIDDTKQIEMSKRQVRRTIDEQKTNTDIDLDIDIDLDKDIDIDLDKDKEKKTFKSIVYRYTQNDLLISSLNDYVEMRKKAKGFTIRALELALKKLDQLSSDDNEKIEIVNESVMNGWKSFYKLKTSNNANKVKTAEEYKKGEVEW